MRDIHSDSNVLECNSMPIGKQLLTFQKSLFPRSSRFMHSKKRVFYNFLLLVSIRSAADHEERSGMRRSGKSLWTEDYMTPFESWVKPAAPETSIFTKLHAIIAHPIWTFISSNARLRSEPQCYKVVVKGNNLKQFDGVEEGCVNARELLEKEESE